MDAGIDEAGRGPVIGPLVVAGVAGDGRILEDLECRDSKLVAPGKREHLARQIVNHPDLHVEVRVIHAHTIDEEMARSSLNKIEIARFQDIAASLVARGARRLIVDAVDVDASRFQAAVAQALPPEVMVVAEHKADTNHVHVGAASIVAKAERDRLVATLARRLERSLPLPLGSGYPSDPRTQAFLANWHARFGDLPEGTRHSWAPAKAILAPRQARLMD